MHISKQKIDFFKTCPDVEKGETKKVARPDVFRNKIKIELSVTYRFFYSYIIIP